MLVFYIYLSSPIQSWIIPGGEFIEAKVFVEGVGNTGLVPRKVG
jgi:hypothetical protein